MLNAKKLHFEVIKKRIKKMLAHATKATIDPVNAYFLTTFSKATIESSRYRMSDFCSFTFGTKLFDNCDWSSINHIKVLTYVNFLQQSKLKHNSINTTIAVIKAIALQCWQLNLISCDTYMRIKTIKKVKGSSNAAGRTLTRYEINIIKRYYSEHRSDLDIRDFAIFALGVGAGLRRKEISTLDIEHISGGTITVTGKGNHTRVIPLARFVQSALDKWLTVRGGDSGAVFTKTYKNSVKKRLSILSVHRTSARIIKNTGVETFTSHDLRRTFATTLLDENADKFAVQRLLGHSSLKSTDIYDRRPDRNAKAAIDLLPF